jgi:hypothetical protein
MHTTVPIVTRPQALSLRRRSARARAKVAESRSSRTESRPDCGHDVLAGHRAALQARCPDAL